MPNTGIVSKRPRVLGVLIARDEWPLLGLSITHALTNHVDEILVVDHASQDGTQAGLSALKSQFGERLQVIHMCEGTLHHEETNLTLKTIYQDRGFDWVYPIDADEFLITENNASLSELLAAVKSEYQVVRYELHNFVTPSDFVEEDFTRYGEITEKAIVESTIKLTHEDIVETIVHGSLNFFQVPFPSKVIFRLPHDFWAASGSHGMVNAKADEEFKFPEENTFVAHLPFLTESRLIRRAARGADLVRDGYPRNHGWQSQVVNQVLTLGRLHEYWSSNSISGHNPTNQFQGPNTQTDLRLRPVLEKAANELQSILGNIRSVDAEIEITCDPVVSLTQAIHAVRAGIQFTKQAAAASENHLNGVIANLEAENARLLAYESELKNSISWRITALLRVTHRIIGRAKENISSNSNLSASKTSINS